MFDENQDGGISHDFSLTLDKLRLDLTQDDLLHQIVMLMIEIVLLKGLTSSVH